MDVLDWCKIYHLTCTVTLALGFTSMNIKASVACAVLQENHNNIDPKC